MFNFLNMPIECLLIDDDIDDQEIFLMALNEVGTPVHCLVSNDCIDGLKKLSPAASYAPDYIFLDVNLHKMDGIDCLQEIKKMEHLANSNVIMFSTTGDTKVIRQCLDLGASRFLVKPPSLSTLIEELANILK